MNKEVGSDPYFRHFLHLKVYTLVINNRDYFYKWFHPFNKKGESWSIEISRILLRLIGSTWFAICFFFCIITKIAIAPICGIPSCDFKKKYYLILWYYSEKLKIIPWTKLLIIGFDCRISPILLEQFDSQLLSIKIQNTAHRKTRNFFTHIYILFKGCFLAVFWLGLRVYKDFVNFLMRVKVKMNITGGPQITLLFGPQYIMLSGKSWYLGTNLAIKPMKMVPLNFEVWF